MNKILKIENGIVTIGMADGTIKECHLMSLDFQPKVGDVVDVYSNGDTTYVKKAENATDKKKVNKLAYLLLCFFLGGIGAHKFYAGKVGLGVVYLLFCWTFIPGFVALIEFIIGLFKQADENGNIIA